MSNPTTISGMLDAKGLKIAILATRFNDFIVDRLTGGALDYLERHGLDAKNITIVRIPGAFEMPLVCQKLAASGKYDGIVALGTTAETPTLSQEEKDQLFSLMDKVCHNLNDH